MILACNCKNKQQDEMHKKGNRVMNVMKGGDKARCTVCLTERPIPTGKRNK